MPTPEDIERYNRKKYEHDYSLAQVSIDKSAESREYFRKLVAIKLDLIKKYGAGKRVLDIGCGSGDYLLELHDIIASGCGIDYTAHSVVEAEGKRAKVGASNLTFLKCNARQLPFAEASFDLIFSFSTLSYVPRPEDVVSEVARTLKPEGIAILEMGNLFSLNTIVCNAHPEWAKSCHIKISEMKKMVRGLHLKILEWRTFQVLPLWGKRPGWLKPLLHPRWKKIMQTEIAGRMFDEWLSGFPFIRHVAFRHILVCQKTERK